MTARFAPGALCAPLLAALALACSPAADAPVQLALEDTPRASAPDAGLDSVLLAQAYARAAELPRLRSLLVARNGELLAERYYNGATAARRTNIKSASKSVLSALVGIAIAEGKLEGVDQPIAPFFPRDIPGNADPRIRDITIAHLLSMRAGLEPTSFGNYGDWVSSRNWVRYVLSRPFVDDPGGRMLYSTGSTHLLSAILTRATGMSTLAYAREKLGRPLGIEIPGWTTDPQGIYFGGNEMSLRPRDLFAFGELYRNGGRANGRQVVPASWVEDSWTTRTTSPFNGYGYGLGWWQRTSGAHDVRFAWGYGGQYVFIVPALALTVVMTSDAGSERDGSHNRALHALLGAYLVPAAERGRAGVAAPQAAAARRGSLP